MCPLKGRFGGGIWDNLSAVDFNLSQEPENRSWRVNDFSRVWLVVSPAQMKLELLEKFWLPH